MNDNRLEIVLAAKDTTGDTFDKVQSSITGLSKSIVSVNGIIASFAGAAGIGLVAKQSIDAIAEIDRLSTMAGVTTESFQELTFAAEQYQISQDALTDGLKELSLRGDEFVKTGAGPAKESFERLGYSADDLNKMLDDTPGLLSDIISRMEGLDKAAQIRIADEIFGGTGGEQFVAMIRGGANALDTMRKSAHELGVVIDDDMVAQSVEAKKQVEQLTRVISAQFTSVVAELTPNIIDLSEATLDWTRANSELLKQDVPNYIHNIFDGIKNIATSEYTKTFLKVMTIGGLGSSGSVGIFGAMKGITTGLGDDLKALQTQYQRLTTQIEQADFVNDTETVKILEASRAEIEKKIEALQMAQRNNFDWKKYNQEYVFKGTPDGTQGGSELIGRKGLTKDITKDVKDLVDANLEGWFNDVDQAAQKYVDLLEEGANVTIAMRNPTEQLSDETARLNELFGVGAISAETYGRAIAKAQDDIKGSAVDADLEAFFGDIDEESKILAEGVSSDWEKAFSGWANSYSSTLNDMLWESELSFDGIAESFAKMITEMLIQQELIKPFMSWGFGGSGGGGGFFGNIISGIFHDGGVVGSGDGGSRAVSPMVFADAKRFHTGLMPDEFPAILQQGESVFTANQTKALAGMIGNSSGPNVQVNIENYTNSETDVSQTQPEWDGDKWVMNIVLKALNNNTGNFKNTMKAKLST